MAALSDGQIYVGIYLFSRAAARQVSSAQVSLTSVFGMGTGGPLPQSTTTVSSFDDKRNYIIRNVVCQHFFNIFFGQAIIFASVIISGMEIRDKRVESETALTERVVSPPYL